MTLIGKLEVVGGFYKYSLPGAFFPDYRKHGIANRNAYIYQFAYEVSIFTTSSISNIILPPGAEIFKQNDTRTSTVIRSEQISHVDIFYRTIDTMVP